MEVISKGTLPKDKVFHCGCHKCGAFFSFKKSEAQFEFNAQDGEHLSIRCPTCDKKLTHSGTGGI